MHTMKCLKNTPFPQPHNNAGIRLRSLKKEKELRISSEPQCFGLFSFLRHE